MIKRAKKAEIHWLIPEWNVHIQAYNELRKLMGDISRYFAPVSIVGNEYQWQLAGDGWQCLSAAADSGAVKAALKELGDNVQQKLGTLNSIQNVKHILTVPNDDYIFFRPTNQGLIDITITGWAFKNFRTPSGYTFAEPLIVDTAHRVNISFINEGAKVPNRKFILQSSMAATERVTDNNGDFLLGDKIPNGTRRQIVDMETGRTFVLEVVAEQEQYDFDITPPVEEKEPEIENIISDPEPEKEPEKEFAPRIKVVNLEGNAFADYPISVQYNGTTTTYRSDAEGMVYPGTMKDKTVMRVIDGYHPDNIADYKLDAEQEEYVFQVPFVNTDSDGDISLTVIDRKNNPVSNCPVILKQNDKELLLRLDENGHTTYDSQAFELNKDIEVNIDSQSRTFPTIKFQMEADEKEYVLQEVDGPTPWWHYLLEVLAALACAAALSIAAPYFISAALSL